MNIDRAYDILDEFNDLIMSGAEVSDAMLAKVEAARDAIADLDGALPEVFYDDPDYDDAPEPCSDMCGCETCAARADWDY